MANMNFIKKDKIINDESKVKWKVLITDDDEDIHTLTKTVLSDFEYDGKKIEFISTYNEEDTINILKKDNDIAMILLDVVMEKDDSGLIIAKRIREELNNNLIQIILRTGQPGCAPETNVVVDYAINDYKEKTELTSKKLLTTIITALRSYKTLKSLEASKLGLQQIIDASENLYNESSSKLFMQGILSQIISILKLNHDAVLVEHNDCLALEKNNTEFNIINTTGNFEGLKNFNKLDENIKQMIIKSIDEKKSIFKDNICIGYIEIDSHSSNIIYISNYEELKEIDKNLIEVFFKHTSVSLHNIKLNEEMFSTQKTLIEVLGDVVEKRYIDDPFHIKRVAQMSYLLAIQLGISEEKARMLEIVSPMHDVGKIGIPDSILLKPGKLNDDEFEKMKEHTTIGFEILKGTNKETLNIASLVSHEHHERWDGKGYPNGLKGDEISVFGRITAIIDVFDALANKRCYKEAWEDEQIKQYLLDQSGSQFDPHMVEIMVKNYDDYLFIQNKYKTRKI